MNMAEQTGTGWMSDFYGTAATLGGNKSSILKALRDPFAPREGFRDFYEGMRAADVPFLGFVSCAPQTRVGSWFERRTLDRLKLGQTYPFNHVGILNYPAALKASLILGNASRHKALGVIDDRPVEIGIALIARMRDLIEVPDSEELTIVLGVAAQNGSMKVDSLLNDEIQLAAHVEPSVASIKNDGSGTILILGKSSLQFVPVDLTDPSSGTEFGEHLNRLAAVV